MPDPEPPRRFAAFACFDWSGQAVAHPPGITLATCHTGDAAPLLSAPPSGWSRPAALDWLIAQADAAADILIGIDFSPSLPFVDRSGYFPEWRDSPADARGLWALVDRTSEAEPHLAASGFAHHPHGGRHYRHRHDGRTIVGDCFGGTMGRLRATEARCRTLGLGNAVSGFNLIGPAQVGKSSLTGMRLLHRLGGRVPIWPFDPVPAHGPLIVEVYTTIAARAAGVGRARSKLRDRASLDAALAALDCRPHLPLARYSDHATDAILGSAWLRHVADRAAYWAPPALNPSIARTEGWTFGVP